MQDADRRRRGTLRHAQNEAVMFNAPSKPLEVLCNHGCPPQCIGSHESIGECDAYADDAERKGPNVGGWSQGSIYERGDGNVADGGHQCILGATALK